MAYDIDLYPSQSGRIIGEDGETYNLVDLLKNSGGGGGDMLKETYDTNNNGKVDTAESADSVPWSGVTGKPSAYPPETHNHDGTYAPASHTHSIGDVNSLQTELDDIKARLTALEGA